MFAKGFQIGERWNHQYWVRETVLNDSNSVPPLYLLIKDHKSRKGRCLPATRQVVSNNKSMGVHLSNGCSEVTEALGVVLDDGFCCISTEDLLARYDIYNEMVMNGQVDNDTSRIIQGANAVALFPSLDPNKCAQILGEEFGNSDLELGMSTIRFWLSMWP